MNRTSLLKSKLLVFRIPRLSNSFFSPSPRHFFDLELETKGYLVTMTSKSGNYVILTVVEGTFYRLVISCEAFMKYSTKFYLFLLVPLRPLRLRKAPLAEDQ
jgi:hypothetical protein